MATCKDCIHQELCKDYVSSLTEVQNADPIFIAKWLDEIEGKSEQADDDCEHFKDRSHFVDLPDDFPKGRLTTDNPLGNFDALMNYAYAKDGNVLIRYANNQENMDLCDYIAHHAKCECAINAQEVLDGACFECDDFYCPLGRAYFASVQAAELRERLKMYEDLAEQALKER